MSKKTRKKHVKTRQINDLNSAHFWTGHLLKDGGFNGDRKDSFTPKYGLY